jgi:cyclohexa-1,5-dienecarbonyl-CoA hydratase
MGVSTSSGGSMNREFEHILFEREGGVARITLNQPPVNIMDIPTMREMVTALEALEGDQEAKVVLFGATGKAFCAGVDVKDHTADKVEEMVEVFHRIFRLMWALDVPTVAAVNGAALGGGCELVTFCDMIIASEKATLGQPEIQVGVYPPVAVVTFPRLMPHTKAMELLLTGAVIDAREAERLGIVNKVVPAESFEEEVSGFVGRLTSLSGAVLRLTKRATLQGLTLPFEEALRLSEDLYLNQLMKTEDAAEGLSAFMEKRKPVWKDL